MISCNDIERADGVVDCRHRITVDVLFCSLLVTGYFFYLQPTAVPVEI